MLGLYLEREPAAVELRFGSRGKPMLAASNAPLRFNLSHSGGLALIAVAGEREVGVDVQSIGARPAEFYADWARREAIAKCHGTGLWAPAPDAPVAVAAFDAGAGFGAAIAVSGNEVPPLRHFVAKPG
jgi:4'-phosphopantetheinyl transferase